MSSPKQLNQSIPAHVHINPPFRHCLEVTVVMASLPLQPSLSPTGYSDPTPKREKAHPDWPLPKVSPGCLPDHPL